MRFVRKRKSPVWLLVIAIIPIGFFALGSTIGSDLSPRRGFIVGTAASFIGVLGAGMNLHVLGRPWTLAKRAGAVLLQDAVAIGSLMACVVLLRAMWS